MVNRRRGTIAVSMAELLMNSAIPSEGAMQTRWPALRNLCWANDITQHGGKGEWQTSPMKSAIAMMGAEK